MKSIWYAAETGNHQGLIIEESTGKNIAVAYDKAHAPLIAAAPELLAAGEAVINAWESGDLAGAVRSLSEAIQKAKGE